MTAAPTHAPTTPQGGSTGIAVVVTTTADPLSGDGPGTSKTDREGKGDGGGIPWLYIVITVVACTLAIVLAILYSKKKKKKERGEDTPSRPPEERSNQFTNPVYDTSGATSAENHRDPVYDDTLPADWSDMYAGSGSSRAPVVANPTYVDSSRAPVVANPTYVDAGQVDDERGGYVSNAGLMPS
jgi:hypothetical protein